MINHLELEADGALEEEERDFEGHIYIGFNGDRLTDVHIHMQTAQQTDQPADKRRDDERGRRKKERQNVEDT